MPRQQMSKPVLQLLAAAVLAVLSVAAAQAPTPSVPKACVHDCVCPRRNAAATRHKNELQLPYALTKRLAIAAPAKHVQPRHLDSSYNMRRKHN